MIPLDRIGTLLRYALVLALCVSGVYALVRLSRLRLHIERPAREGALLLFVFYLSALVAITAVRGAMRWNPGGGPEINWRPLATTAGQWRAGAWPFAYHAFGNALWFAPLGFLLPALWRGWNLWRAALAGIVLSVAIEASQWLFATGAPDIDDVVLNALGAALGYGLHALWRRARRRAA